MKVFFFRKKIRFAVLIDLHILGCPELDLLIFGKCLSVQDKHFVPRVTQKLMKLMKYCIQSLCKLVSTNFW